MIRILEERVLKVSDDTCVTGSFGIVKGYAKNRQIEDVIEDIISPDH